MPLFAVPVRRKIARAHELIGRTRLSVLEKGFDKAVLYDYRVRIYALDNVIGIYLGIIEQRFIEPELSGYGSLRGNQMYGSLDLALTLAAPAFGIIFGAYERNIAVFILLPARAFYYVRTLEANLSIGLEPLYA